MVTVKVSTFSPPLPSPHHLPQYGCGMLCAMLSKITKLTLWFIPLVKFELSKNKKSGFKKDTVGACVITK